MERNSEMEDTSLNCIALDEAKRFFRICDYDKKGFVTKSDMRRLQKEWPKLTDDHLDEVFDSLDRDANQRLTVEEFVYGIAPYLGLQTPDVCRLAEPGNIGDELALIENKAFHHVYQDIISPEEKFQIFIERVGCEETFQDQSAIKALWSKLNNEQPELLDNFEEFLEKIGWEMQKKTSDFVSLEKILKQRISSKDDEVQRLYEEMEAQIRQEKERILSEERKKAEKIREELERKLATKDQEMQDLMSRQAEMEKKLETLADGRSKNEQLQKERKSLIRQKEFVQHDFEMACKVIKEREEELEDMKRQHKEEPRFQSVFTYDGIACEKDSLIKELDKLRLTNKKLAEEKEEIRSLQRPAFPPPIKQYGCIHSGPVEFGLNRFHHQLDDFAEDERHIPANKHKKTLSRESTIQTNQIYDGDSDFEDEDLPRCLRNQYNHAFISNQISLMSEIGEATRNEETMGMERVGPLGGNEKINGSSYDGIEYRAEPLVIPERIFKVVFLGDSGVGKTCFVHRFCHNRFIPTFSATIGVDFQVKTVPVDGRWIALQLWDTAGQERFRSITKQYFRKADGVVLMYDVTSELSFLHLRNWLQNVKEGVEDDFVLCLIGNKIDLCPEEESRVVKYKDGQKLAEECGAIFLECSAQTGVGIQASMHALAMLLREREDKHLEKVLHLEMEVQKTKRGCCSKQQ